MRSHQSLPLTCPLIRRYAPPSPDREKAFVSAVFSLSHMITLCAKGLLHIIWCNSPFCIYAIFIISYHWIAKMDAVVEMENEVTVVCIDFVA